MFLNLFRKKKKEEISAEGRRDVSGREEEGYLAL